MAFWKRKKELPTISEPITPGTFKERVCAIEVDGVSFKFGEIWITPELDDEKEKIHLTAWHPRFEEVPYKKMMVLFLSLDEALGEYGTDASLGGIEIGNERLAGAFPLSELHDFVERTEADKGWKRLPPTESATVYQPKSPSTADLLLLDGARSLATVMEVLREQRLPTGTALHFFAKGNEGRRMFL